MSEAVPPLDRAYALLRSHFGFQDWWPAETPFEVCVGAILVQNTTWIQVERTLDGLKSARLLDPIRLWELPVSELEARLRPSGTFRVKATRLRSFLRVLVEDHGGSLDRMWDGTVEEIRARLLAIPGIGPETADCLVLYAAHRPIFVVDAYTRRVFRRHGWPAADGGYSELQSVCSKALPGGEDRVRLWQDVHAQFVAVGKEFCRASAPQCLGCPLETLRPGHMGMG